MNCCDHNCPFPAGPSGYCDRHCHEVLARLLGAKDRLEAKPERPCAGNACEIAAALNARIIDLAAALHTNGRNSLRQRCVICSKGVARGDRHLCAPCEADYQAVRRVHGLSLPEWTMFRQFPGNGQPSEASA